MQVWAKAGQTILQDSASRLVDPETLRARVGGREEIMGSGSAPWSRSLPNPLHSASLPDQQVGHFYPAHFFHASILTLTALTWQSTQLEFLNENSSPLSLSGPRCLYLLLPSGEPATFQLPLCRLSLICWTGHWTVDSCNQVIQLTNSPTPEPHNASPPLKRLTERVLSSLIQPLTAPVQMQ